MSEEIARIHQPAAEISEEALKRAEELINVHKEAENIKLENQKSEASPIPWHPGAVKYFAEKGIKIK